MQGRTVYLDTYQQRFPGDTEEILEIFPKAQVRSLRGYRYHTGRVTRHTWVAEGYVRRRVHLIQDDCKISDCFAWQRGPD